MLQQRNKFLDYFVMLAKIILVKGALKNLELVVCFLMGKACKILIKIVLKIKNFELNYYFCLKRIGEKIRLVLRHLFTPKNTHNNI